MMNLNPIFKGDCIEIMKLLADNCVDAIVTDPPYGIGFMGKNWDTFKKGEVAREKDVSKDKKKVVEKELYDASTGKMKKVRWVVPTGGRVAGTYDRSKEGIKSYQNFMMKVAQECLRVLKPGGYMLASCSTRMYHRMVCGIEDAGFEIRDTIMWLYGSGFPKSLNIGKQIDKMNGKSSEDYKKLNDEIKRARKESGLSLKEIGIKMLRFTNNKYGSWYFRGGMMFFETMVLPSRPEWDKLKQILPIKKEFEKIYEEAEREVIGKSDTGASEFMGTKLEGKGEGRGNKVLKYNITKPSTPEAKEWEGWGTALKPACEPIVVARKPLSEKNVALNVLKWGTGGINIDESRIGTNWDEEPNIRPNSFGKTYTGESPNPMNRANKIQDTRELKPQNPQGRFPANIILDEEAGMMLDEQSETNKSHINSEKGLKNNEGSYFGGGNINLNNSYSDSGGASRFFYCAKASKSERNKGCEELEEKTTNDGREVVSYRPHQRGATNRKNNHPTVKPIALMEYLVKLVSKEGALVLDPFGGSGTTGIACKKTRRNFILIEKEQDYIEIAKARLKPYLEQETL